MSTTVVTFRYSINGDLTDATSVVFADATNTYGLMYGTTVLLPAGTALTKTSTGVYSYTITDPAYDLVYTYVIKVVYNSVAYYIDGTANGTSASIGTAYLSYSTAQDYFDNLLETSAWDNATSINKNKALANATLIINRLNFQSEKVSSTQDNEFPRLEWTTTPQDILDACCEIALALLKGLDPEIEFENLAIISHGYSSVRATYIRDQPQEHILAGVPSSNAWRLLKPYLRDAKTISLSRVS